MSVAGAATVGAVADGSSNMTPVSNLPLSVTLGRSFHHRAQGVEPDQDRPVVEHDLDEAAGLPATPHGGHQGERSDQLEIEADDRGLHRPAAVVDDDPGVGTALARRPPHQVDRQSSLLVLDRCPSHPAPTVKSPASRGNSAHHDRCEPGWATMASPRPDWKQTIRCVGVVGRPKPPRCTPYLYMGPLPMATVPVRRVPAMGPIGAASITIVGHRPRRAHVSSQRPDRRMCGHHGGLAAGAQR